MSQRVTYPSHNCSIDQDLPPSWLQDCSLQGGDYVPHMEVHNILQLVGCAVQQAGRPRKLPACWVLLDLQEAYRSALGYKLLVNGSR